MVVLPERGALAALLEANGATVALQPLALGRVTEIAPGAAATVARVARDRLAVGRLARRHGAAVIHSNTSLVLAGGAAARRAGAGT